MYFTKYLPVEGDIKEGDLFLHKCSAGSSKFLMRCKSVDSFGDIWQEKHDQVFPPQRIALYKHDCQKVKLFLCSRDIQVGDEFYENTTKVGKVPHHIHIPIATLNNQFKVIGEVSSDAVWVTEGMEFEDADLAWNGSDNRDIFLIGFDFKYPDKDYKEFIYVKSSQCKHFH